MCEKMHGYICKKVASTKPLEGTKADAQPGCQLVSYGLSLKYRYNNTAKPLLRLASMFFCLLVFRAQSGLLHSVITSELRKKRLERQSGRVQRPVLTCWMWLTGTFPWLNIFSILKIPNTCLKITVNDLEIKLT